MDWRLMLILSVVVFLSENGAKANPHAKKLYDDLMANYNRLIRPVSNNTEKLTVKLGLKLSQLIDVDLKNQVMTTNVWVEQKWHDFKLAWDPEEYGGVDTLYVPSQHIWLPDIVLFNNADGKYEVTLMTKAVLSYTGEVNWKPPAIYKSSCKINVEWFPFDEQNCDMKFGSWTYDGYQLDLKHVDQERGSNIVKIGIDLKEFYHSVEWDILEVPATRNEEYYVPQSSNVANGITEDDERFIEEPSQEERERAKGTLLTDITFYMTLRRKTLFYTVNLIIPCVGISFLTVLVFYLPSDSGEKVTLCISILLSLTVFFLLLAEIIPPTSLAVPLLGKYLLFTMILVTLSICVTVGVLNVHFRSPATHHMSPWVRKVFINIMPKILLMDRPTYVPRYSADFPTDEDKTELSKGSPGSHTKFYNRMVRPNGHLGSDKYPTHDDTDDQSSIRESCTSYCHHHPHLTNSRPQSSLSRLPFAQNHHQNDPRASLVHVSNQSLKRVGAPDGALPPEPCGHGNGGPVYCKNHKDGSNFGSFSSRGGDQPRQRKKLSPVAKALKGVEFIAKQIRKTDQDIEVIEDWKFIAMVLDRLFLWLFTIACIAGSAGIILMAPSLYDMREPIDQKLSEIPKS